MHLLWLKMYAPAVEEGDDARLDAEDFTDGSALDASLLEEDAADRDVGAGRVVASGDETAEESGAQSACPTLEYLVG
jgi:hypothetical protein